MSGNRTQSFKGRHTHTSAQTCSHTHTCACTFVVLWHAVAWTFTVVNYASEATAEKSCKHGDYRSFEHLLFLGFMFVFCCWKILYDISVFCSHLSVCFFVFSYDTSTCMIFLETLWVLEIIAIVWKNAKLLRSIIRTSSSSPDTFNSTSP